MLRGCTKGGVNKATNRLVACQINWKYRKTACIKVAEEYGHMMEHRVIGAEADPRPSTITT